MLVYFGEYLQTGLEGVPEIGKSDIHKSRGAIPRGYLLERRRKKRSERCIPKVRGSFWEWPHRSDQRTCGVLSPRKRMIERLIKAAELGDSKLKFKSGRKWRRGGE